MSTSLQERVEELAVSRFGLATAISLDLDSDGWHGRVWNKSGSEVLIKTKAVENKHDALAELHYQLKLLPIRIRKDT